jgi:hypothetical protein
LKQQLVSQVEKSKNCGFGLCPKKYKYLANPKLLESIFSVPNSSSQKIAQVKRPRHLHASDSLHTTNCIGCNREYLLRVDNPLCSNCRRMI